MSRQDTDILHRLADFDGHGGTATERYAMRMDAWTEITQLRQQLTAEKAAREMLQRQINERHAVVGMINGHPVRLA